jgi:hypothetical protein
MCGGIEAATSEPPEEFGFYSERLPEYIPKTGAVKQPH